MAQRETVELFITMSDTSDAKGGSGSTKVKFAWRGNKVAYPDDISKELGVAVAKANEPGLIFGMNKPRPARVYVNVKMKQGKSRAFLVFANPNKLAGLLIKNSLKGKSYRGGTISGVSLPKTSTNPTRSKKASTTATGKPPAKKPPAKKPPARKK